MKDLGPLHYYHGIGVHWFDDSVLLNQVKYSIDLLKHAQMAGCKSISTPMMTKLQAPADGDVLFPDPHLY